MNPIDLGSQDYTIFGFSRESKDSLEHRMRERLGIFPQIIGSGPFGHIFVNTTYAERAENDGFSLIKLGFLRSPTHSAISADDLLSYNLIRPGSNNYPGIAGNALVVCLSKTSPTFTAYKTIMGVPQLYYWVSDTGIICSDRLNCLVRLLDRREFDEDLLPLHFLFRSMPGELTYYRHIRRMLPGHLLQWNGEKVFTRSVETLDFGPYSRDYQAKDNLVESFELVIADYIRQANVNDGKISSLLSGGVDSSLLQYFLNQKQPGTSTHSFSYAVQSPGFEREIDYARQASNLFHTEHTFIGISPQEFPGLLTRAVEILAQPPILETEPSMLSIAEYTQNNPVPSRYFLSGQGADTLFGLASCVKLQGVYSIGRIPGAAGVLKGLGKIFSPFRSFSRMLSKGADILLCAKDPNAFLAPVNSLAVYADLEILRKGFGDEVLIKALRNRRDFAANYLNTDHYLEKVHVVDLMTDTYELGIQRQQIFLAHQKEQLHPFFDDEILRAGFTFSPDSRYIRGLRPKYLLKDLLTQKTGAPVSRLPKGFSVFEEDLFSWMKSGPLRPLVEQIERPGFLSRQELNRQVDKPGYFLWVLLNWDIFRRRWLANN